MNTSHECGIAHYYPEFTALDDGRFRCLAMTLGDGRYVVITNTGGMEYPHSDDFMVCVYRNAEAFGDDPSVGLLGSFTSDDFADIDHALGAAEFCTEVTA